MKPATVRAHNRGRKQPSGGSAIRNLFYAQTLYIPKQVVISLSARNFGDTRDLFKFDLVRHIMKSLPDLKGFTFVPMLTGN